MMGAVVLAAGRSQRMGRPKLTLPWGDTTVVGQVVKVLVSSGVEDVIVVTGGDSESIDVALKGLPVRTIFNPDYANGEMLMTLQLGLAALSEKVEAALVVLGDQPQIDPAVVQSVIFGYINDAHSLVVPSYQKRRGHPWLVVRQLWKTLLDMRPPATMRDFLNQQIACLHYVNVDTPSILQDLDTPEDYQRFNPRNQE
jgi:molybdenum cofactor cytidylyltransferase